MRKRKNKKREKWTYGLAAMVVVLGLALGVVAWGNKNGLTEFKNQITGLPNRYARGKDKDKKDHSRDHRQRCSQWQCGSRDEQCCGFWNGRCSRGASSGSLPRAE